MAVELATTLTPTEDDRLLQAEGLVRGYCGWHIAPSRTETLTVDGSGSSVLTLPTLHLMDVTEIVEGGTTLEGDAYQWSEAGYLTHHCYWTCQRRGIDVSIVHGYAEVPPDVTMVVQAVAQRLVASSNGRTVSGQSAGPFSVTFDATSSADGFLPAERIVLDRYKLPSRP